MSGDKYENEQAAKYFRKLADKISADTKDQRRSMGFYARHAIDNAIMDLMAAAAHFEKKAGDE